MNNFEESVPEVPAPISPTRIEHLRESNHTSQLAFAELLNMHRSAVCGWESGRHKPGPLALKLLSIVEKHGLKILA